MSNHDNEIYDVIIIGAGISGLVCGCYLSKAGMKVLVVEQHDKPGGYCTSFKRQGFTFDAAAHSLGSYRKGGSLHKIIKELNIDKMIKITRCNPSDIILTPDHKITFWNNEKETIDNLIDIFPQEKDNIIKFYSYFDKLNNNSTSAALFESVKLQGKTFDFFLRSFFTDAKLINAISCTVFGYVGLPPSLMQAATGIKIFNEYVIDGGYYPEGGMQKLPDALATIIRQNSGKILFNRLVNKILSSKNIVQGIKLDNNDTYQSKYVVSACDITQTFKTFLGDEIVDKSLLDKLDNFVPSISTFILYIGLDGNLEGIPKPGTNMWYLPYFDLDKIYACTMRDDFWDIDGGYVFRVSPDKKTILLFCLTSFKEVEFWKQNKKRIAEGLLNRLEMRIPNLRKHIVFFDAATPNTLFRFTKNYKGANYGWELLPTQSFDPDFRQKTYIKGLYLTGHWTTQTHGIPSVATLGHHAAKFIIKREQSFSS
jgi:phytoene dehydrogenase-like protein